MTRGSCGGGRSEALCRRSNWRQPHARQVADLALGSSTRQPRLHALGPDERELLEFGGLLHDIGEHVSRQDHDRHSAYLIEHGGLRGFSPQEVRILTTMGRYHVRGTPKPTFEPFAQLKRRDRARAVALTAILRLAEGLDASHRGLVQAVRAEPVGPDRRLTFVLTVRAEPELELWTVRRKQVLLERTLGVECAFRVEPGARPTPDAARDEGARPG